MDQTPNTYKASEAGAIFRLPDDVLVEISLWNTNIFMDGECVKQTLAASQVCHRWRTSILHTPMIWGRLFDLNHLNQDSDNWRSEMLRRSGNAMLWIRGDVASTARYHKFFFNDILRDRWSKIQHLRIYNRDCMDESYWGDLLRPAPHLCSFVIHWNTIRLPFPQSSHPLFASSAPTLRQFTVVGLALDLSTSISWFTNLRHLDLGLQSSAEQFVSQVLPAMGHLHTLSIHLSEPKVSGVRQFRPISRMPIASLPKLTSLRLNHPDLTLCMTVLAHIKATKACQIELESRFYAVDASLMSEGELSKISSVLSSTFRHYIVSENAPSYQVRLLLRNYAFQFICHPYQWRYKGEFTISIRVAGDFMDFLSIIPPLFSTLDLSLVEYLDLTLSAEVLPPIASENVLGILRSFSSLTTLQVGENDLRTLQSLIRFGAYKSIFPEVQTLHIGSLRHLETRAEEHPLIHFLRQRQQCGKPIENLHLSPLQGDVGIFFKLEVLNDMDDLTVHWHGNGVIHSYLCGSPSRVTLDFMGALVSTTSNTQGPSPALQLPDDILIEIITLNTNIFLERECLKHTLAASQVCSAWRTTILHTPTIWGRLFDLSYLNQLSDDWRNEMLRRSRPSMLWICGDVRSDAPSHSFFFNDVLRDRWSTIEHLRINNVDCQDEEHWGDLHRPAPYLKSFAIYLNAIRLPFSQSTQPLFANSAPSLRQYTAKWLALDLSSSWITNLRHLEFALKSSDAAQFLDLLPALAHLQSLSMHLPERVVAKRRLLERLSRTPVVKFPELTSLSLDHYDLTLCLDILAHIHPEKGCGILFLSRFYGVGVPNDELQKMSSAFALAFESYIIPEVRYQLKFSLSGYGLHFSCHPSDGPVDDEFILDIMSAGNLPGLYDTIPLLLSNFDVSSVGKLDLIIRPSLAAWPSYDRQLLKILRSFSSVTELELQADGIRAIRALSSGYGNEVLFPSLQLLHLNDMSIFEGDYIEEENLLGHFLQQRKACGLPIMGISFSWLNRGLTSGMLNILDGMEGLPVSWYEDGGKRTYICGSSSITSVQ
ncbi:hypothetical protein CVT26_002995 [Gymnopilus dilepis]|uniref:F-box domain-containing protein n=1 Tax=Gymnopilus dilepis TaxID=231916 RepID=A0A409Y4H6_9AGAR|nr:hypothetical protein CVT26_002995 [Gymnopilus dilepis]